MLGGWELQASRRFRELLVQLWALLFLLKNIYLGGPGRYRHPLSTPLTCVGRLRTSCMVPSPLCGQMVFFVNFINKTHMKNHKFKGSRQTLYLCPSLLCAGCGLRARCLLRSSSSSKTSLNNSKDTTLHCCAQAADFVCGAFAIH